MMDKPAMSYLEKASRIYQDRLAHAARLKSKGEKFLGYVCCYVPVEIITAGGLTPFRVTGRMSEPVDRANDYLETIMCSFTRSIFDLAIQGDYDFLEGFVVPHACDNIVKLNDVWRANVKKSYHHFINVPHIVTPAAIEFFEGELDLFRRSIENFTDRSIKDDDLGWAINEYNENRRLVRRLYELRQPSPPLISSVNATKVLIASVSLGVEESNQLLKGLIAEAEESTPEIKKELPRLMIHGAQLDDVALFKLIEEVGANVVIDDLCLGTRPFMNDVDQDQPPLQALAQRYFKDIYCPRTVRVHTESRQDDLEMRFGHIRRLAQDWKVDGIILHTIRYCDIMGFDIPDLRDYLQNIGIAVLHIEDDYHLLTDARLKTRVEAFLEIIASASKAWKRI